jgi:hypothetical protein
MYRANYPEAKLVGEKLACTLNEVGVQGRVARLFHSFGPGIRSNNGRSFQIFYVLHKLGTCQYSDLLEIKSGVSYT